MIAHNNQTSLSSLLTHFLLSFGNIQFMARLGSVLFGVLVILLVFVLGKKLFSRTEGLMAAVFVSISPYLIQFFQYSRAYALFVLLAVLSFYLFLRAWRENRWHHWVLWALSSVLAIYNHLVALLILPAYVIFMGFVCLEGKFGKTAPLERSRRDRLCKRFVIVTAGLIACILRYHIAVPAVRVLTVILAAAGVVFSWKKYRREMILATLFMAVPYLLFLLSHPAPSNTLAADRFFLFLLPLFLILAARGLTAGHFAGLKGYYLNFWRLSSWKIEPKLARCLERQVKSDALIYFDFFPFSSLNLVVNPLTRDLRLEEAEHILRDHLRPRPEKNDLLFYALGFQEFRTFVAGRDVELWAAARLNAAARSALLQAAKSHPGLEVEMLDECAVLCLRRSGASAARKLSSMAGLFLSLPWMTRCGRGIFTCSPPKRACSTASLKMAMGNWQPTARFVRHALLATSIPAD